MLFSHSVMSDSFRPHGLQHARLRCPLPPPRACSNSCPLSQWCHPTISSSAVSFSSWLLCFPASGSFPMSGFFVSVGQSIGASALAWVHPVWIFRVDFLYDWLVWSSCSPRDSLVFSNTTVQKHQFFSTQPSLWSNFHIHMWLLEKPIALTRWTFVCHDFSFLNVEF